MARVILDLCGGTGAWSAPYRDAGYDVRIVDIVRGFDPIHRFSGDVRLFPFPDTRIRGVLAAPPCTHFAQSGARWWKKKGESALLEALAVVDACLRVIAVTNPQWWALENPAGRLETYLGPPAYTFHPCDHGDPYTKETHLWGTFTPPVPSPVAPSKGSAVHRADTARERSITPPGFAWAFFNANP